MKGDAPGCISLTHIVDVLTFFFNFFLLSSLDQILYHAAAYCVAITNNSRNVVIAKNTTFIQ